MRKILLIIIYLFSFDLFASENLSNCNYLTEKYGKIYKLPQKLLTSIALVESGVKKNEKPFQSWPWTLNVSGKSIYFDSKFEILEYLKENINKKKSIDVGCMQINTSYHLKNFKDLSHIIEPEENVKYDAIFLSKLYKRYKSLNEAVSRYHSSIPKRKKRYLKKVHTYWNDLRQKKIIINSKYDDQYQKEQIRYFRQILENEKI